MWKFNQLEVLEIRRAYLVGGMISTTSKKNTWRLIKIEIDNVTFNVSEGERREELI